MCWPPSMTAGCLPKWKHVLPMQRPIQILRLSVGATTVRAPKGAPASLASTTVCCSTERGLPTSQVGAHEDAHFSKGSWAQQGLQHGPQQGEPAGAILPCTIGYKCGSQLHCSRDEQEEKSRKTNPGFGRGHMPCERLGSVSRTTCVGRPAGTGVRPPWLARRRHHASGDPRLLISIKSQNTLPGCSACSSGGGGWRLRRAGAPCRPAPSPAGNFEISLTPGGCYALQHGIHNLPACLPACMYACMLSPSVFDCLQIGARFPGHTPAYWPPGGSCAPPWPEKHSARVWGC